jgi:hypothetical protein
MKILKKEGVVEKRGEEETKSMLHAPVFPFSLILLRIVTLFVFKILNKNLPSSGTKLLPIMMYIHPLNISV